MACMTETWPSLPATPCDDLANARGGRGTSYASSTSHLGAGLDHPPPASRRLCQHPPRGARQSGETSIMCANWQALAAAVVCWVVMDHPGCGEASVGLHISTCTGAAICVRQCHRPLARMSSEPAAGRRSPARRASSTPRAAEMAWILFMERAWARLAATGCCACDVQKRLNRRVLLRRGLGL